MRSSCMRYNQLLGDGVSFKSSDELLKLVKIHLKNRKWCAAPLRFLQLARCTVPLIVTNVKIARPLLGPEQLLDR